MASTGYDSNRALSCVLRSRWRLRLTAGEMVGKPLLVNTMAGSNSRQETA